MNELEYFICGGVGGLCAVLVGHPFDTVKVRLQTMSLLLPAENGLMYKTLVNCVRTMITNEGFLSFYKGMNAPLVAVPPQFATAFMCYRLGEDLFTHDETPGKFDYKYYLKSGTFSGVSSTLFLTPAERIKCLLQVQTQRKRKKYTGPVDCVLKLYKKGGLRNVYRGVYVTAWRNIPATGVYFLSYEYVRDRLSGVFWVWAAVFSGIAAGVSFWVVAMPFDMVKNRYQTAPNRVYQHGSVGVFLDILKHEDALALYKGFVPVMMRALVASPACFLGFELVKMELEKLRTL